MHDELLKATKQIELIETWEELLKEEYKKEQNENLYRDSYKKLFTPEKTLVGESDEKNVQKQYSYMFPKIKKKRCTSMDLPIRNLFSCQIRNY